MRSQREESGGTSLHSQQHCLCKGADPSSQLEWESHCPFPYKDVHTAGTEEGSRTSQAAGCGWEQAWFCGCTGVGHDQNEPMPIPLHTTQSFYICSFFAPHAVPGPSLLSMEGASRGLLEDNRGKESTHRLKHFALMPECDLCNNCPSTGDTRAVLPARLMCHAESNHWSPCSDVSLCPWLSITNQHWTQAHPILWTPAQPWDEVYPPVGAWGKPSACPCSRTAAHQTQQPSPALLIPVTQRRDGKQPFNSTFRGTKGWAGCGEQSHQFHHSPPMSLTRKSFRECWKSLLANSYTPIPGGECYIQGREKSPWQLLSLSAS